MGKSAWNVAGLLLGLTGTLQAATQWSTQDYDLYAGDFNGDGLTDLLYIAHDSTQLSGIALSDGKGFNIPLQSWNNAYLGIPWSDGKYRIVVADFNGDGKDDLFLQRKEAGDHFLLLTEDGGVGAISQTLANDDKGLIWSADQHLVVAGDFNGDGRADLFLQAADAKGLSAVLLSDENGQFTSKGPDQSWEDGYAGFDWAVAESNVFTGDFNGDKKADLLIQAKPVAGTGPGTKTPAQFTPNSNGVVLSAGSAKMFATEGAQAWSRDGFKAEWSPLLTAALVGDFDGDGRSDVILQGLAAGDASYALYGNAPGAIFVNRAALPANAVPAASDYRLLAGKFDAQKSFSLYLQAQSAGGTNSIQRLSSTALKSVVTDSALAVSTPATPLPANTAAPGASAAAALAVTSAGRTPGQFSVSALGGAMYTIPIWTPPGARGIEPKLSLVYTSGGQDGPLGPGWALAGLSAIARCNKTYADNAGAPAPVTLTASDDFCLDGNRLRLTNSTTKEYQTQMANFSRVTANGTAGTGPAYFIVEGKDGLIYEYGYTADSKAYTNGGSTPYAWMLNKVRDRQNNNLVVSYSTTSGAVQPVSIWYTQTPATGTAYPNIINFTYQNRVTNLSRYVAGGNITQTQVLAKITEYSSALAVREYNLSYQTAPTTVRDRLYSIQECGGNARTDCLRPTTITYQDGAFGVATPSTSTGSGATNGKMYSVDINADGREDLVFATTSGSNDQWWVQLATASGYGAPINTGIVVATGTTILMDDFLGNGNVELLAPSGSTWYVYTLSGSAFTSASTGAPYDSTAVSFATADVDGDGRPDLVWSTFSATYQVNIYVRRNTSSTSAVSFAATASTAFTTTEGALGRWYVFGNNSQRLSPIHHYDFDADGRDDIVATHIYFQPVIGGFPTAHALATQLVSRGTTFSMNGGAEIDLGTTIAGSNDAPLVGRWNDDACPDLIGINFVSISACNGSAADLIHLNQTPSVALDWDGDGRTDVLSNSGGTWMVQRSLGNGVAAAVSTGIAVGSGTWAVTDRNGDGLSDLLFANSAASNAIYVGLHNGASTPADLATSIADGWGIKASPTYVPITTSNYSKNSNAAFPYSDFIGPMYVVSQVLQSDGIGNGTTYSNSFYYYGAQVNRQGRGFAGFYTTRSIDSRNGLYDYTYYRRDYPLNGLVSQRYIKQPNNTSFITSTVNILDAVDLSGGSGCTANSTSATSRCFPRLRKATVTSNDLTTAAPLIQTSVTDIGYDSYGNATTTTTTVTDNDTASPFSGQSWSSVVTQTITPDVTNWCLGMPTSTTTQNTVPGQSALTRRVDHSVDTVKCRNNTETIEPSSTTLKVVKTFAYDNCGNLNSVSVVGLDKSGAAMPARVTSSGFGTACMFAETVTNALGQTASVGYDYRLGVKTSTTDANGISVSWVYDNFGRKIRENRPDSTYSTWNYTDCISASCWGYADLRFHIVNNRYDSTSSMIRSQEQYFDGLDRVRFDEGHRVLGTWTNVQTTIYNSLGLKQDVIQPYSTGVNNGYHHFAYDLLNRPISDALYNSNGTVDRTATIAYAGLKTTLTDPVGNVTQKWTDVTGKLRRIIDPSPGGTTNYTFDPFGNLIQMVDATGVTTTAVYNLRGFKTSSSDPDTGNWTFTPNSLNELVQQVDAKGQTISMGYDKLGRMISRLEPESATATSWTYGTSAALHEIGQLKSVTKPDGYAESYTFDAIGRPASATITEDTSYTVNYAYNTIGAVDTVTYPTSTSSYRLVLKNVYSYGFLQQVKDNAAGTVFWRVSAANDYSSPTTEQLGNGAVITSSYQPWTNDILTRQVGTGGSTTNLQNLAYNWTLNGNLHQRQDLRQSLTEIFYYDALNRLDTSTLNGAQNLNVDYDAAGNITLKSDVGSYLYTGAQSGCSYYAYAQPHAVRKVGSNVYCYDANGNMTSRAGSAITWYSYNQPKQINSGSNYTQFNYNASHQRWKQVAVDSTGTTTTYYVGGILEKVTRPSGVTEYRHMIPAGTGSAIYTRRSDSTTSTYYASTDHLGSGDLIMDSAGSVLARESFTAFGARRGSNWTGLPSAADNTTFAQTTRRGFTGHEMLDAVSLIHMNGRVYDPQIGRFLSADPIVQTINVSQALNPFSYVMNNPLALIDPSGYSWLSKIFHAIGNFFQKYWRPIVAIIVAVVTYGYAAPYFSAALSSTTTIGTATVGAYGMTATVTVSTVAGTITTAGAVAAGALSGAIAGSIVGGWKGALVGAVSGAMFGGIGGKFGSTWNSDRVALTGVAGGISSEVGGGNFWQGLAMGLGIAALQWAAYSMREQMIEQSKLDPNNASGVSDGINGDHFKLAGGRWWQGIKASWARAWQPFGGSQGGGGMVGPYVTYAPGGGIDYLLESFAGPHDFLNSFQYAANGDLAAFWQVGVGNVLGEMSGAITLFPAATFVGASAVPEIAFVGRR